MSATVLKCPSCYRPLSCAVKLIADRKTIYVYCGYGPCEPAELGGDPEIAGAATVEESYENLMEYYRNWCNANKE